MQKGNQLNEILFDNYSATYLVNKDDKTAKITKASFCFFEIQKEGYILVKDDNSKYVITEILENAFDNSLGKCIDFSDSFEIRYIHKNAFQSARITSITLPSSIIEIDERSIQCPKLESIKILPKCKYYCSVDDKMILKKSSLEKDNFDILTYAVPTIQTLTIPSYVEIIGPYSFSNRNKLKEIKTPSDSKLRIIGNHAFFKSSLSSIQIPSTVTEIADFAFFQCLKIQEFEFPNDSQLQKIGKRSFFCTSIKQITIPRHVTVIGEYSFEICRQLQFVNFHPNSELQIIKKSAFSECIMESIEIPSSVIKLEKGWCSYTNSLNKVKVMPGNKYYKSFNDQFILGKSSEEKEEFDCFVIAARNIESIQIPSSVEIICQNSLAYCEKLHSIDIPIDSKLKIIELEAFSDSSIESLVIPSSVVKLENEWCSSVPSLKKIKVMPDNKYYKSLDDQIILGKSSEEKEEFDVFVFAVRNIESLTIPNYIEIIGNSSFDSCKKLQTINFSTDSKLKQIETLAFFQSSIKFLTIPKKVIHIFDRAFLKSQIQSIDFANDSNLQIIDEQNFCYTKNLNCCKIPLNSQLKIIDQYLFADSGIRSISIPTKVEKICKNSFFNCFNLRNVFFTVDSKIQEIENQAFSNSSVKFIEFPPNLTKICENSFFNCKDLIGIGFMDGSKVQVIEKAFAKSSLKSIYNLHHAVKLDDSIYFNDYFCIIEFDGYPDFIFTNLFYNRNLLIMVPVGK